MSMMQDPALVNFDTLSNPRERRTTAIVELGALEERRVRNSVCLGYMIAEQVSPEVGNFLYDPSLLEVHYDLKTRSLNDVLRRGEIVHVDRRYPLRIYEYHNEDILTGGFTPLIQNRKTDDGYHLYDARIRQYFLNRAPLGFPAASFPLEKSEIIQELLRSTWPIYLEEELLPQFEGWYVSFLRRLPEEGASHTFVHQFRQSVSLYLENPLRVVRFTKTLPQDTEKNTALWKTYTSSMREIVVR